MGDLAADDLAALTAVLAGARSGAVVAADNLDALAAIPDGAVDLVYADPPFATGVVQRLTSIRTGAGERTRASDKTTTWQLDNINVSGN